MNSTHTHTKTQAQSVGVTTLRPVDVVCSGRVVNTWEAMWGSRQKWGSWHAICKNGLKMCRRTSDVSLVSKWDSSMNMYCMLIPHAWLKLLMKTEDTFPHLHSGEEVLSTNLLSAQPHPWARGQSGDRWQISVTAAKVTLQDGLWGPTGDWSSAGVCSFYCHLDLLWLYTGWLD